MPTNKAQNGKTFADLAKEINSKYEDMYDPISQRGKKHELNQLKDSQEKVRAAKFQEDYVAANMNSIKAYGGKMLAGGGPKNDPYVSQSLNVQTGNVYNIDELSKGERRDIKKLEKLKEKYPEDKNKYQRIIDRYVAKPFSNTDPNDPEKPITGGPKIGQVLNPEINSGSFAMLKELIKRGGLDLNQMEITSMLRTEEQQAKMKKNGRTPAENSLHLKGNALDFGYSNPYNKKIGEFMATPEGKQFAKDFDLFYQEEDDHYHMGLRNEGDPGSVGKTPEGQKLMEQYNEEFSQYISEDNPYADFTKIFGGNKNLFLNNNNNENLNKLLQLAGNIQTKADTGGVFSLEDGEYEELQGFQSEIDHIRTLEKRKQELGSKPQEQKKMPLKNQLPDSNEMTLDAQIAVEGARQEKAEEMEQANLDSLAKASEKYKNRLKFDTSDLRYAPVLMNALNLLGKKPEEQVAPVNTASTSAAKFDDVDMSGIKRDVIRQGASMDRDLERVSGGNAGAYAARKLLADSSTKRAIAGANMQGQMQQTEIDKLNASENARVDQFNAGIQRENNRLEFATNDINAANQAASQNIKQQSLAAIGTSLGNIGKEDMMRDQAGAFSGYYYDKKNNRWTKQPQAYGGYLLSKMKKKKK